MSAPEATATRTLVLGLGNDILADDAVGLLAARALRPSLDDSVDVLETSVHGVALIDLLIAEDRRARAAESALRVVREGRGATDRTVLLLAREGVLGESRE